MKFQPLQSLHPGKGRRKQADLMVRTVGDKIEIEAGNGATYWACAVIRCPKRP